MTEQTEITKHTEQTCAESVWFRLFRDFRLLRSSLFRLVLSLIAVFNCVRPEQYRER